MSAIRQSCLEAQTADLISDPSSLQSDKSLAARTIIIHPGSTHVRVGLATDVGPVQWPNVLARRSAKAEAPSKSAKASSPDAPQNGTSGARQQGEDEEMEGTVEGEAKKADPVSSYNPVLLIIACF